MSIEEQEKAGAVEILSKATAIVFQLEAHGELTAQELAARVSEPVSSTYRLLTQLTALGWVEPGSRRGLHRLGVLFLRLGGLVEDLIDIRAVALPTMRGLKDALDITVFLCVRRGAQAVCIERVDGGAVRSLALRIGGGLPLHSGAAPLAILAFLPPGERMSYLADAAVGWPEDRLAALEEAVHSIQHDGYSMSDGDVTPGIAALGAPIYNHRGELEASVSVSGLRHMVLEGESDTPRLVRDAAAGISSALGYREAG